MTPYRRFLKFGLLLSLLGTLGGCMVVPYGHAHPRHGQGGHDHWDRYERYSVPQDRHDDGRYRRGR